MIDAEEVSVDDRIEGHRLLAEGYELLGLHSEARLHGDTADKLSKPMYEPGLYEIQEGCTTTYLRFEDGSFRDPWGLETPEVEGAGYVITPVLLDSQVAVDRVKYDNGRLATAGEARVWVDVAVKGGRSPIHSMPTRVLQSYANALAKKEGN